MVLKVTRVLGTGGPGPRELVQICCSECNTGPLVVGVPGRVTQQAARRIARIHKCGRG